MLEKMAWNIFKETGSIDTFLELIEVKNMKYNQNDGEMYGEYKNEGDNISRK